MLSRRSSIAPHLPTVVEQRESDPTPPQSVSKNLQIDTTSGTGAGAGTGAELEHMVTLSPVTPQTPGSPLPQPPLALGDDVDSDADDAHADDDDADDLQLDLASLSTRIECEKPLSPDSGEISMDACDNSSEISDQLAAGSSTPYIVK